MNLILLGGCYIQRDLNSLEYIYQCFSFEKYCKSSNINNIFFFNHHQEIRVLGQWGISRDCGILKDWGTSRDCGIQRDCGTLRDRRTLRDQGTLRDWRTFRRGLGDWGTSRDRGK